MAGIVGESVLGWDTAKPATISLPVAYDRALVALGSRTNELHCLGAEVTHVELNGEAWVFFFYSTNTPPIFQRVFIFLMATQTSFTDRNVTCA